MPTVRADSRLGYGPLSIDCEHPTKHPFVVEESVLGGDGYMLYSMGSIRSVGDG